MSALMVDIPNTVYHSVVLMPLQWLEAQVFMHVLVISMNKKLGLVLNIHASFKDLPR